MIGIHRTYSAWIGKEAQAIESRPNHHHCLLLSRLVSRRVRRSHPCSGRASGPHTTERILRDHEVSIHQITQRESPADGTGEEGIHGHADGLSESAQHRGLTEFRVHLRKGETGNPRRRRRNHNGHNAAAGDRGRNRRRYPTRNHFGDCDTGHHATGHLQQVLTTRPAKDRGVTPVMPTIDATARVRPTPTPTNRSRHRYPTPTRITPATTMRSPPHIGTTPTPGIDAGASTTSTTFSCHFLCSPFWIDSPQRHQQGVAPAASGGPFLTRVRLRPVNDLDTRGIPAFPLGIPRGASLALSGPGCFKCRLLPFGPEVHNLFRTQFPAGVTAFGRAGAASFGISDPRYSGCDCHLFCSPFSISP